jgi:hypothetical protein
VRILALVALLVSLPGCGLFRQELPPWARPVPAAAGSAPRETPAVEAPATAPNAEAAPIVPSAPPPAPPVVAAPASVPAAAPVALSPPPPAPAPVTPARPPAPPAVPPPVPAAAPPATAAPAPPAAPGPPLTASLPLTEVRRLQDEANRAIEETERRLRLVDGRSLGPTDLETLRLAQGLVEQARRALGGQEYERAANLATKARTLADDLSTRR